MDQRIKDLWNNNKILFFILIPIILIAIFKDALIALLIGSARLLTNKAKQVTNDLEKESVKVETQADAKIEEASKIEDRIKARDENDIDEDWYKK